MPQAMAHTISIFCLLPFMYGWQDILIMSSSGSPCIKSGYVPLQIAETQSLNFRTPLKPLEIVNDSSKKGQFNRNQIFCTFDLTISRVLFVSLGQCADVESLVDVNVYEVGRPMVKPKVKAWPVVFGKQICQYGFLIYLFNPKVTLRPNMYCLTLTKDNFTNL